MYYAPRLTRKFARYIQRHLSYKDYLQRLSQYAALEAIGWLSHRAPHRSLSYMTTFVHLHCNTLCASMGLSFR